MDRGLPIPEESPEVKRFIHEVRAALGSDLSINWDPMAAWAGNKVQSYLWKHWKTELEKEGLSWQKFLRLMSYRTDDAILWMNEKLSWDEFVGRIIEMLEGPLADIVRRG